jgi:Protein of unknown function (DUF2950)
MSRDCEAADVALHRPGQKLGDTFLAQQKDGMDAVQRLRGKMLGGFALVAYPANWGNSGVMTFMVNHDGVVYQKDLGPETAALACDDAVQSR